MTYSQLKAKRQFEFEKKLLRADPLLRDQMKRTHDKFEAEMDAVRESYIAKSDKVTQGKLEKL